MNRITIRIRHVAAALVLVALSACGESSIFGPDNQLQVTNIADDFHLQAQAIADQSGTETYQWEVSTTTASVSHAHAALTAGSATLTILDADGAEVYSAPLSDASNGDAVTAEGTVGTWTVTVTLNGATTDHINFQLADVP